MQYAVCNERERLYLVRVVKGELFFVFVGPNLQLNICGAVAVYSKKIPYHSWLTVFGLEKFVSVLCASKTGNRDVT